MMKVADINTITSDMHSNHAANARQAGPGQNRIFARILTSLNQAQYQHHINDLQSQIEQQGALLKGKADVKELQKYRQLIIDLLSETVSNSFEYSKSDSFSGRSKHKTLVIIRNVNEKLDELTKEILAEQSDTIKLLEMVDDIRGLLIDLFL